MTTFTKNKALILEETLLFEQGSYDKTGVDLADTQVPKTSYKSKFLNGLGQKNCPKLPSLSEPETIRHYTRLSQKNYSIDGGIFPLGSCTMKYNPRLNETIARLSGIADIHPLQPENTVQGMLGILHNFSNWLIKLTAMHSISLSPASGAQGELCGMLAIKSALADKPHKNIILIPESAHGTNPATAIACGFTVKNIALNTEGTIDIESLKANLNDNVAGIMITNPNTCGLFEKSIKTIAKLIHKYDGYCYCDGANFNAIIGKITIGDLGIDAMHINIHKTLSTPHGGGGPGAGPVVFSKALTPFAPLPIVHFNSKNNRYELIENKTASNQLASKSFGRLKQFHGQVGLIVRALCYLMAMGKDGLKTAAEDAVLNANYLLARLKPYTSLAFKGYCMHELLINDSFLENTNINTLDFAKALIDEGFHPMTIHFPLTTKGAMLIEPTETETKTTLDQFADTIIQLAKQAQNTNNEQKFKNAPIYAPRERLDETMAARKPILTADQTI